MNNMNTIETAAAVTVTVVHHRPLYDRGRDAGWKIDGRRSHAEASDYDLAQALVSSATATEEVAREWSARRCGAGKYTGLYGGGKAWARAADMAASGLIGRWQYPNGEMSL